ncbi:MAG TPA: polysaccharide deacetylase family protein [Niabella sp.]|nr:polysaccharide deacetylase family protein [Niabella sp.]
MLNFRNTNIAFALLLIALLVFDISFNVPFYAYLLPVIFYLSLLFYGSYFVHSQFYMKTICKADINEKKIAVTFDDGPLKQYTPQILHLLKTYDIKATFFCIGKNAAANTELLRLAHQQGHTIGSHSYTHGYGFDLMSSKNMHKDLEQMHQLVKEVLGIEMKWFRPPYGVTTPNLKKAVEAMNYTAIGWNVRSMDTMAKNETALLKKLQRALKPGSIFLFHDTAAITVSMLSRFIEQVQQAGYEIVPLEKLINLQSYAD